jgi:hypothetical protein
LFTLRRKTVLTSINKEERLVWPTMQPLPNMLAEAAVNISIFKAHSVRVLQPAQQQMFQCLLRKS